MKKAIALLMTILSLFAVLPFSTFASTNKQIESENDVISADEVKITQLIESFFSAKQLNFSSGKNDSLAPFYTAEKQYTLSSDISSKLFEFEKLVRQEISDDIITEDFQISINDILISGSIAKVSVYEYYEYMLAYSKGIISSRGVTYWFDCEKVNNEWRISNISTDNMIEDIVADVEDVSTLFTPNPANPPVPTPDPAIEKAHQDFKLLRDTENQSVQSISSYTFNTFDLNKAIAYALEYTNHNSLGAYITTYYNPLFKYYEYGDCQNFVSQCIWAGLDGENTSTAIDGKQRPMITESGREWWATSSTTHSSWTWTGVDEFAAYVSTGGYQTPGLFGSVGSKGYVSNGQKGDIIHLYSSNKGWHHAMIIVDVTGPYSSRTNADYYICAHTSNRRNETIESILGSSYTDYRLVTVGGCYM